MSTNKITNNLKSFLEKSQPINSIEVVIELTPTSSSLNSPSVSRSEKIALLKQTFIKVLEPIAEVISKQGGDILDSVWLNQTIKAKISTKSIEELAQLKEVNAIDLPNRLTRD